MTIKNLLFFTIFALFFIGCSDKNTYLSHTNLPFPSASLEKTIIQNQKNKTYINKSLSSFYNEWKGVRYKFGGNSKKGIDCSAFIQRAYKKSLNIQIPRTTLLQSRISKNIKKSKLKL